MHNTDSRRIKRSSIHLTSNQAIKVNFRRSKILIPVANGSTGLVSVTTPCANVEHAFTILKPIFQLANSTKIFILLVLFKNRAKVTLLNAIQTIRRHH